MPAYQTCLIRSCPNEQNVAYQTREQLKEIIQVFDRMFDGLQIVSNTTNAIKHDQTR